MFSVESTGTLNMNYSMGGCVNPSPPPNLCRSYRLEVRNEPLKAQIIAKMIRCAFLLFKISLKQICHPNYV